MHQANLVGVKMAPRAGDCPSLLPENCCAHALTMCGPVRGLAGGWADDGGVSVSVKRIHRTGNNSRCSALYLEFGHQNE